MGLNFDPGRQNFHSVSFLTIKDERMIFPLSLEHRMAKISSRYDSMVVIFVERRIFRFYRDHQLNESLEIPRLTGLNDGEEMEKTDRKAGGKNTIEEVAQTEVAGARPTEGVVAVHSGQRQDEMLKEINGNSKTEGAVSGGGNEAIEGAIEQGLCEYHRRMQMQKDKEKGKQEKQQENRGNGIWVDPCEMQS